jgi:transposase-like protein
LYLPNVTEIEEVRVRDQPGEVVGGSIESTLTFRGFPPWHWRRIRTSNPLERTMRQVR